MIDLTAIDPKWRVSLETGVILDKSQIMTKVLSPLWPVATRLPDETPIAVISLLCPVYNF